MHVEFGADLSGDRVVEFGAVVEHERSGEGLAHSHLGVGARRASEGHETTGIGHRGGQCWVVASAICRPVRQVHRSLPGERREDLIGQERAERGQQL